MSWTYVIADLHGRLDLLDAAVAEITRHSGTRSATVVALGDYIDRGPSSRQIIQRLRSWDSQQFRLVALKGNHEAMACDAYYARAEEAWWLENGGDATLRSYGIGAAGIRAIPLADIEWMDARPLIYVDAHRAYVHAGVDGAVPLARQSERVLLWKRYRSEESAGHGGRHVVHGHDGGADGPILSRHRSNLDCLAWATGTLAIGVFADDTPGGPAEVLKIQSSQPGPNS